MTDMQLVFLDAKTYGEVFNPADLQNWGSAQIYQTTTPDQTIERCRNASIIITNKVVIDQAVIDASPMLRLICVAATGTNNVDTKYAESKGVVVKNITDYSTQSVAQITFGLIFQLLNQITYHDQFVKRGDYSANDIFTHLARPFHELNGKNLGILGLGNIGRRVAEIATAFGARVSYHSLSGNRRQEDYPEVSLRELLKTSDLVTIHSPLSEASKHLIDLEKLKWMKPSALLINAGRGGIIVEEDLATALNQNLIAGAGLDVFENEPIHSNNPLLNLSNPDKLVLSPHIAWASVEARTLALQKIYNNIREFIDQTNQQ